METIAFLSPLATVVICLVALFTGMGWIFNWLLAPVKENQRQLKQDMSELKSDLKSEISRIETKIDRLIEKQG